MDAISEFFTQYDGLQAFRETIYLTLCRPCSRFSSALWSP